MRRSAEHQRLDRVHYRSWTNCVWVPEDKQTCPLNSAGNRAICCMAMNRKAAHFEMRICMRQTNPFHWSHDHLNTLFTWHSLSATCLTTGSVIVTGSLSYVCHNKCQLNPYPEWFPIRSEAICSCSLLPQTVINSETHLPFCICTAIFMTHSAIQIWHNFALVSMLLN